MKRFTKQTALIMAVLLMLGLFFQTSCRALDTDNVISIAAFSDGADFTIVEFIDDDTGVPYKAFIDKEGNFACCTYTENVDKVIAMSGQYIAFSPMFAPDEFFVADISQKKIIFSSMQSSQCDEILDMGSWQGECYFIGHTSFAGFDKVGETYTIFDGNGRSIFEKTYDTTLKNANYIGEGWFIFAYAGGALYINGETGQSYDFSGAANWADPVSNGHAYNYIGQDWDAEFVCIDLNSGMIQQIKLPDNKLNRVITGQPSENKIVAFEYDPYVTNMVKVNFKSIFYYSPEKGVVEITAWADHVFKSNYSSQFAHCRFVDGKLLLPMEGADGSLYVGLVDENNNQLIQPIKTDYYRSYAADDGRIIVQQDGIDVVFDVDGNQLFSAVQWGQTRIEPYANGFARVGDGIHFQLMIDPDGNLLMNELYVDVHSMALMDLP